MPGEPERPVHLTPSPSGRPGWLKVPLPAGDNFHAVRRLVRAHGLHTVCESARCPNIGECWQAQTATFLILGDTCTRACAFCAVHSGAPAAADPDEGRRVAEAVATLGLRFAVVTSVTRDDLPDGGAAIFADTIRQIHTRVPDCRVEVLIPDFQGDPDALATVVAARPDVLNHNIETVPRLYPTVRPQADYRRSLALLAQAKALGAAMTKSGLMVGLGETTEELLHTCRDLRAAGCELLTIGQYLRPSREHLPIERYYTPDEFADLATHAEALGFTHVEAAPLVRSSYHAHTQAAHAAPQDEG